jgi:hypothetical protein
LQAGHVGLEAKWQYLAQALERSPERSGLAILRPRRPDLRSGSFLRRCRRRAVPAEREHYSEIWGWLEYDFQILGSRSIHELGRNAQKARVDTLMERRQLADSVPL